MSENVQGRPTINGCTCIPPPCIRHPIQICIRHLSQNRYSHLLQTVSYMTGRQPIQCKHDLKARPSQAHKGSNKTPSRILYKTHLLPIVTQGRCLEHGGGVQVVFETNPILSSEPQPGSCANSVPTRYRKQAEASPRSQSNRAPDLKCKFGFTYNLRMDLLESLTGLIPDPGSNQKAHIMKLFEIGFGFKGYLLLQNHTITSIKPVYGGLSIFAKLKTRFETNCGIFFVFQFPKYIFQLF